MEQQGNAPAPRRFIRMKQVIERTALSRATINSRIAEGRFPKPYKDGSASLWLESDVDAWMDNIIAATQPTALAA